ncbi:hypothetical protein [Bradyrhizobium sp. JR4.1]|uniref:hypothetical protein n=1 Tax=Bradyrhizobium sp. JR4.1 TaxID=3156372 RepID=UPI003392622C
MLDIGKEILGISPSRAKRFDPSRVRARKKRRGFPSRMARGTKACARGSGPTGSSLPSSARCVEEISARPSLFGGRNTIPSALSNLGGNPIRWRTWNSFDADLSAEKKRDSIELLASMPSVARLSRGRAEAARQGQKALTKLVAAVGLFLRMTARTSVIAKRWAREAAVFLRASVVVLSYVRFQLSVCGTRHQDKIFRRARHE